jgi:hypothetical protein
VTATRAAQVAAIVPLLEGWALDPENLAGQIVDTLTTLNGDDAATFRVSKAHPDTSRAVSTKVASGTFQADVLAAIRRRGAYGATDDELEVTLGRTHQSVSAARNTLVRKGQVIDSGRRRKTRSKNAAIVWLALS